MREGVNHIQNCKHLAKQYFELIHSPDFGIRKLWLFAQYYNVIKKINKAIKDNEQKAYGL